MHELRLRPSRTVRSAYALLFAFVGLVILSGLKDVPPAGVHDYFVILFTAVCFYAAVTYPLRAVIFANGAVRVRSLGRWSTIRLPPRVRVTGGLTFGSVYLGDDATGVVLLVLKREFGSIDSLEARIKSWLRSEGRLAEGAREEGILRSGSGTP